MRAIRWLVLFLALFPLEWASAQASGNITNAQCVTQGLSISTSVVGIQVTGTWTGTLQPQVSVSGSYVNTQVTPSTSNTAQATITANGVFYSNVGGATSFQVCGNTVGSGTATVFVNATNGVNASTLGSGGGSGTVSPNSGTAGAVANYAAAGGSTTVGPDANLVDNGTLWLSLFAFEAPDGTCAAPGYRGTTNTSGLFFHRASSDTMTLCFSGAGGAEFEGVGDAFEMNNNWSVAWSSGNITALGRDTGISRPVGAVVSVDTTSAGNEAGLLRWNTCKPTSAATMSVSGTAVTFCSWSLPASAKTWSWQCSGTYTTTTATDTFSVGMNAAQAPTSETGNAIIYSTLTGTSTAGSATSTSSGNQNILTGASVSNVTNEPFSTSGTIQASVTAGTFALTGTLTGTSPSGTVNVGTTCILY